MGTPMDPNREPPGTLVITTDVPFFPGKMGCDFFNLRHLSGHHAVGVIGPLHDFFSPEGIRNLESFLTGSYFWPRPVPDSALPPLRALPSGRLKYWIRRRPPGQLRRVLLRLLGLHREPPDAYAQVATLANCAPYLLAALAQRSWQTLVLIQTNTAPWLDYLPAHLAKLVYFHDVRSGSLRRGAEHEPDPAVAARQFSLIPAVARQEARVCREADVVGFVSDLDERRAQTAYAPAAATGVAPLPVDTDYFHPPAADWPRDPRPVVLFTGHLSHPPNVDAVLFFLEAVWPRLRQLVPGAVFQAVGCLPADRLQEAARALKDDGFELHADVPDIRPYFWNASAYVVPMRFGGGVRQKIFETWSMRVPLVCTTMAVEGTRAEHGVNCWLEDDPAAYAARVAALLAGTEPARDAVVAHARETALAFNSIPAAATRFECLVDRAAHVRRQRPYRLLIDLRWMEIGKAGGVEQMTYELVSALSRLDHRNAYRLLCPRSTFHEWDFPRGFQCRGFFTDKNEARAEALHAGLTNALSGELRLQPILTPPMRALRAYRKMDFDLVHALPSYTFPDLACFPTVLTVHDLQHLHHPEFFTPENFRERDNLYRTSCAAARHILCISEFTRQDVHARYGVPLEKMTTVWNIPSRAAWLRVPPARRRALLAGMGIAGRFFFFPAHGWPHKNHGRLVAAFGLIVKDLPADVRLVFTGKPFPPDHPARAALVDHGLEKRVVHLGYRSPLEMRALYGGALALVFPSLFEGFGMPVAEAMIAGCAVACSNTTSLPEITGEAAVTFDPLDTDAMASAMLRLALDEELRADSIAAGQRRSVLFSARASALKTLTAYRRVFEEFYDAGSSDAPG